MSLAGRAEHYESLGSCPAEPHNAINSAFQPSPNLTEPLLTRKKGLGSHLSVYVIVITRYVLSLPAMCQCKDSQ